MSVQLVPSSFKIEGDDFLAALKQSLGLSCSWTMHSHNYRFAIYTNRQFAVDLALEEERATRKVLQVVLSGACELKTLGRALLKTIAILDPSLNGDRQFELVNGLFAETALQATSEIIEVVKKSGGIECHLRIVRNQSLRVSVRRAHS